MKKVIAWIGVASISLVGLVEARTIIPNKEKEAIDLLFERAHCASLFSEAVQDLKAFVADETKKKTDRIYALRRIRDLACETRDSGLAGYIEQRQASTGAREIEGLPEGYFFQMAAELSVCRSENEKTRILRLEELLESDLNEYPALSVRRWAAEELCDRGLGASLPKIEHGLGKMSSSSREEFLESCSRKLHILGQYSSRLEALVGALRQPDDSVTREMHFWAVDELAKLSSEEAYSVLVEISLREELFSKLDPLLAERALRLLRERGATHEQLLELGVSRFDLARAGFISEKHRRLLPARPDPCQDSSASKEPPELQ